MTQNSAWSLIATVVIAVGFLVGWCAGALELAPVRVKTMAMTGAGDRSTVPARESGNAAHAQPVSSGSTMRDPL